MLHLAVLQVKHNTSGATSRKVRVSRAGEVFEGSSKLKSWEASFADRSARYLEGHIGNGTSKHMAYINVANLANTLAAMLLK
jgi:hypothetical protein